MVRLNIARETNKVAFEHLREAIRRNDALVYGEPPGMPMPVRHPYAALQLEQGNVEEALGTYADDLGYTDRVARASQHPNNVFSLHGYYECLTRLGRTGRGKDRIATAQDGVSGGGCRDQIVLLLPPEYARRAGEWSCEWRQEERLLCVRTTKGMVKEEADQEGTQDWVYCYAS